MENANHTCDNWTTSDIDTRGRILKGKNGRKTNSWERLIGTDGRSLGREFKHAHVLSRRPFEREMMQNRKQHTIKLH